MKQKTKILWYVLAVFAVLLAAPNGTIIKSTLETIDPIWFNALRFTVITVILWPVLLLGVKEMTRRNITYAALAGLFYAVSVTGYTSAINLSQASYVAIISLGIPILLMLFSVYLTKESISRQSFIGISIAALGGFTIIVLPMVLGGQVGSSFDIAATLLALLNCVAFPLMVIFSRKANEAGLSLWSTLGVAALVVGIVSFGIAILSDAPVPTAEMLVQPSVVVAVVYSAVAVSLLSRVITIAAYERIGSTPVAGHHYAEIFLGILIPIVVLGEQLTLEMIIGGFLILVGLLITEIKHVPHSREAPLT